MGPLEHWVVTSSADCSHTDTTDSTEDAHRWSGSGSNIAYSEESFYICFQLPATFLLLCKENIEELE